MGKFTPSNFNETTRTYFEHIEQGKKADTSSMKIKPVEGLQATTVQESLEVIFSALK